MLTNLLLALLLPQSPTPPAPTDQTRLVPASARCESLTEPPCSYMALQQQKAMVQPDDRVLAWIRGKHNGGSFPLRHFIAGPRVINDTYGLFFYDPEGGYVAAYEKAYGYELHGWRNGVMIVRHTDGTLFSALTGAAFAGPRQGQRLTRVPNFSTTWGHWLLLHPESTAYDLFDGNKYPVVALPTAADATSVSSRLPVDPRLPAMAEVLGVRVGNEHMAFPLDGLPARAVLRDKLGGWTVAVFWLASTRSAIAFRSAKNGAMLEFVVDEIAPDVDPIKDRNTGTRWSMAGRGIDGLLRGEELDWVDCIQCKWFAWVAEHPDTKIHAVAAAGAPK